MKRVCFSVRPVSVVNQGARFGPRVATATFEVRRYTRQLFEVSVSADIDGAKYQDESGVRRRAGRAAVPIARRAAALIGSGEIQPKLSIRSVVPAWANAVWFYREEFEGFGRAVRASADFRPASTEKEHLQAPEDVTAQVAQTLRNIATDLHVAIDDPDFRSIFGGR